jgi:hypothetical protein
MPSSSTLDSAAISLRSFQRGVITELRLTPKQVCLDCQSIDQSRLVPRCYCALFFLFYFLPYLVLHQTKHTSHAHSITPHITLPVHFV